MTPKQRMKAAMLSLPADKVPLMCQFSIGHMLLQLQESPVEFWFSQDAFTKGLMRLREIYDFDGILVSLHGHDPEWRNGVKKIISDNKAEVVEWMNGDKTVFPYDELPYYVFKEKRHLIDINDFNQDQLPQTLNYIPVSQNLHFHINPVNKFGSIEYMVEKCGDNYSIHGEITSPFDYFLDITGYQDGLMGLIYSPDISKIILAHFTEKIKDLAVEMCKTGIDAMKISSPYAGSGFISADMYREFVLPYEKIIAEAVKMEGVIVYTHTCGSINDRLELMFESGINGIECLDPPPAGNVELADALQRVGKKGFIKGNIDSVHLLLNGSYEKIVSDVNEILNTASGFPGFILSTACSIAPAVKRENVRLLREIVDNRFKS